MKKLWIILASVSTITLLACGGGAVYAATLKPVEPAAISIPLNADTIFRLVNNQRTKAGLAPLVRDARLDASAQAKADDMATNNYFGHVSPITGKHGYEYMPVGMCNGGGENLNEIGGVGDHNASAVTSWMASKPHHDAILSPENTLTGLAVSGDKVTQHFCVSK